MNMVKKIVFAGLLFTGFVANESLRALDADRVQRMNVQNELVADQLRQELSDTVVTQQPQAQQSRPQTSVCEKCGQCVKSAAVCVATCTKFGCKHPATCACILGIGCLCYAGFIGAHEAATLVDARNFDALQEICAASGCMCLSCGVASLRLKLKRILKF